MDLSENALAIIREFEGLRLDAYLDPARIPTIGWGTIRYPNGRKVRLGDSISEEEADAFLKFECDKVAADISRDLSGVTINQNQFDALLSFCYNVGQGAYLDSTLRKKLKANDFTGAADEFPRWNKATVDGVKVEFEGLTRRRAREKALFEKSGSGGTPIGTDVSAQEKVASAKGFNDAGVNLVASFDKSNGLIEILEFQNSLPETLTAVLRLYPNLGSFAFAAAGEPIPAGTRVKFSGLAGDLIQVSTPPTLSRVLVFGMEDEEGSDDKDVQELQTRLKELGYYAGRLDGIFGTATDDAVRDFQADHFGRAEADGKVGPKTWKKLFGEVVPTPGGGAPVGTTNYLKIVKTDVKDRFGCVKLKLSYFKAGRFVDSIDVCSGAPSRQEFRIGSRSRAGSREPLPEGKWFIFNIDWKDGRDNYSGAVWNGGIGPVKILLDYRVPGSTARSAILFHIDWNRARAAGTAGCVGVYDVADFKKLVGWLRETDPRDLFVDWGLGTCPTPT